MSATPNRITRRISVILLAAISVSLLAMPVPAETTMIVDKATTSHHVPGANAIQGQRRLRTGIVLPTDKEDDGSEDRGITDIAKLADSGTKKLTDRAKKLTESAKLHLTSNNQRATDSRFAKLMAGKTESEVLESPQFLKWVRSVTKSYSKNSEAGDLAMVSTLKTHYGDEALVNLITAAKEKASLRVIAGRLEEAQLKTWVNDGKTVDNVFNLLKLDKEADKLFEAPLWGTWTSYVTKVHDKDADAVMFSTLKTHYGDEALASMLAQSKKGYRTKVIADKLEEVQFKNWASEGKSADDIFNFLKLKGDTLSNSPALSSWITYVEKMDDNPYELLLGKLMKRYDDASLARMLATAKEDYKTRSVAVKLGAAQLKQWVRYDKSPDDVYNLLKLNLEGNDILKSPILTTWISYTMKMKEDPYQLLLVHLTKRFDDATLTKMFVAAKRSHATESIGTKLEEVQLKSWLSDGKTADDVFKLLQLNKDGDTIFASSVWSVWSSYLTKLDKENADELMFVVLKKHYGGDEGVAKMVSVANKEASTKDIGTKLEEELWRSQGKDGNDIFKLLKLDEEGQTFFESPALSTWISYVTKFNKQNPGAISQLEKRFGGDIELARMIGFAKLKATNAGTKKVITQLQNLQFKHWVAAGMTPERVSAKMLLTPFDTRNTKVVLDYYDFYKTIRLSRVI
ncbi:hypothetical protein PRNP1_011795 [Phytophthora ramorum]